MTSANTHEASAVPPTRDGEWQGNGGVAEMPTIWNEGYRGRPGNCIRRSSEMTIEVCFESPDEERPGREDAGGGEGAGRRREDAKYTFLID